MKVVHHERNMGYGAALRTGFSQANKDLVFYTDGDSQYDVRELANLYPLLTDGVDVINGFKKSAQTRFRGSCWEICTVVSRVCFSVCQFGTLTVISV